MAADNPRSFNGEGRFVVAYLVARCLRHCESESGDDNGDLVFSTAFADGRCLFQSPFVESIWGLEEMDWDIAVGDHGLQYIVRHTISPNTAQNRNFL